MASSVLGVSVLTLGIRVLRVSLLGISVFGISLLGACAATEAPRVASSGSAPPVAGAPAPSAGTVTPPSGSGSLPAADSQVAASEEQGTALAPGWLGVELRNRELRAPGALVPALIPGSPAARAGMLPGDIILQIAGELVTDAHDVSRVVSSYSAGAELAVAVLRGTEQRLFKVVLEPKPNAEELMRQRFVKRKAPEFSSLTAVQASFEPRWSKLRGRVVVVEFSASWCVACRALSPMLSAWDDQYTAQGLEIIGVSLDSVVQAEQDRIELGITYDLFADPEGLTARSFSALALPTLFVVDREGIVQDVIVGYQEQRLSQAEALIVKLLAAREGASGSSERGN